MNEWRENSKNNKFSQKGGNYWYNFNYHLQISLPYSTFLSINGGHTDRIVYK